MRDVLLEDVSQKLHTRGLKCGIQKLEKKNISSGGIDMYYQGDPSGLLGKIVLINTNSIDLQVKKAAEVAV